MRTVRDIPELSGATVLLRTDFDVPVDAEGRIEEEFRIIRQKENLDYLLSEGAKVVMVAHASDPQAGSFRALLPQFERLLGRGISFVPGLTELGRLNEHQGPLSLLDNVRRWPGEMTDDETFAAELVGGFDLYVNNAFAVVHRAHASVSAVARLKPAYAGLLVVQETQQLSSVMDAPAEGKVLIMGGAKASTKVPVIDNLIGRAERVLVGGVVAIDIMKARGTDVRRSRVDDDVQGLIQTLDVNDPRLVVNIDSVWDNDGIMDIGPESIRRYREIIAKASMVIWNGPMGRFEDERFAAGTRAVAEAVVDSGAFSLIGGGDTIAAVRSFGLLERFGYVSTGGGAMLAFLSGEPLPGLVPLGAYEK